MAGETPREAQARRSIFYAKLVAEAEIVVQSGESVGNWKLGNNSNALQAGDTIILRSNEPSNTTVEGIIIGHDEKREHIYLNTSECSLLPVSRKDLKRYGRGFARNQADLPLQTDSEGEDASESDVDTDDHSLQQALTDPNQDRGAETPSGEAQRNAEPWLQNPNESGEKYEGAPIAEPAPGYPYGNAVGLLRDTIQIKPQAVVDVVQDETIEFSDSTNAVQRMLVAMYEPMSCEQFERDIWSSLKNVKRQPGDSTEQYDVFLEFLAMHPNIALQFEFREKHSGKAIYGYILNLPKVYEYAQTLSPQVIAGLELLLNNPSTPPHFWRKQLKEWEKEMRAAKNYKCIQSNSFFICIALYLGSEQSERTTSIDAHKKDLLESAEYFLDEPFDFLDRIIKQWRREFQVHIIQEIDEDIVSLPQEEFGNGVYHIFVDRVVERVEAVWRTLKPKPSQREVAAMIPQIIAHITREGVVWEALDDLREELMSSSVRILLQKTLLTPQMLQQVQEQAGMGKDQDGARICFTAMQRIIEQTPEGDMQALWTRDNGLFAKNLLLLAVYALQESTRGDILGVLIKEKMVWDVLFQKLSSDDLERVKEYLEEGGRDGERGILIRLLKEKIEAIQSTDL